MLRYFLTYISDFWSWLHTNHCNIKVGQSYKTPNDGIMLFILCCSSRGDMKFLNSLSSLNVDSISGFSLTVGYKSASLKWTEYEGWIAISLMLYKRKYDTCAREGTAFTLHMFYRKVVLYYIHIMSETELFVLGQWNNCRLNLFSGLQWLFQVVPFAICTLVTAILFLILTHLNLTYREAV